MNNKILGIVGSALLIVGIFLPIVSVMGLINVSYFDAIRSSPLQGISGLGICILGIVGLLLALQNKSRMLILPGVLALGIIVLDFFRLKSAFASASAADGGGEFAEQMASAVSIGWGMYVMAIGAIILIIAGVMKSAAPAVNPGWGAPPPPYPPAR